jgi:DNA-directed RNA polymerase specialized sigma24 family protein
MMLCSIEAIAALSAATAASSCATAPGRRAFLAQGFDAASMGEIARKAGVSKGTLYVYFDSKEQLFEAIAREACGAQAETVFSL